MSDVSLRLRDTSGAPDLASEAVDPAVSPPAARQRRTRWRDPKLWLGILLVLACMVLGARLLSSADDTVAVWQVARDIPAGAAVTPSDLRLTHVHFDDSAVAAVYLSGDRPIGSAMVAGRDLQAGEILAQSAVLAPSGREFRQLPLGVASTHAPADLRPGDHVEVWAVPASPTGPGGRPAAPPSRVLDDVTVLSVGGGVVGTAGERQVLVSLAPRADVGSILRQLSNASLVLVRLGG
jgi:hypothetical protein